MNFLQATHTQATGPAKTKNSSSNNQECEQQARSSTTAAKASRRERQLPTENKNTDYLTLNLNPKGHQHYVEYHNSDQCLGDRNAGVSSQGNFKTRNENHDKDSGEELWINVNSQCAESEQDATDNPVADSSDSESGAAMTEKPSSPRHQSMKIEAHSDRFVGTSSYSDAAIQGPAAMFRPLIEAIIDAAHRERSPWTEDEEYQSRQRLLQHWM